jgi:predicted DNA-binding transcriptional regulator AlpA
MSEQRVITTKRTRASRTYPTALPEHGYVRLPTVAAALAVGQSTIRLWCKKGRFPAPVKLAPRVAVWDAHLVRAFLANPQGWRADNARG